MLILLEVRCCLFGSRPWSISHSFGHSFGHSFVSFVHSFTCCNIYLRCKVYIPERVEQLLSKLGTCILLEDRNALC
jgi:hypothetical protein